MKIQKEFQGLEKYLVGPPDAKHFYVNLNDVFCVRDGCDGCQFQTDCEFIEAPLPTSPLADIRACVGTDTDNFLILTPSGTLEEVFEGLKDYYPDIEQWYNDTDYSYLIQEPGKGLYVFKKQFRYYGPTEDVEKEAWSYLFEIQESYTPHQKVIGVDFGQQEPRILTALAGVEAWEKVFTGRKKEVFRLVDGPLHDQESLIYSEEGGYCYLEDYESTFKEQCAACPNKDTCSTQKSYWRNVGGDFHSKNAELVYQDKYHAADADEHKRMRDNAKVFGLAYSYGASAYTLGKDMNIPIETATQLLNTILSAIPEFVIWSEEQKKIVREFGYIQTPSGRIRYVEELLTAKKKSSKNRYRQQMEAERYALNVPVQGYAADVLKEAHIAVLRELERYGWCPYGSARIIPQKANMAAHGIQQIASVHDEILFLVEDYLKPCIPDIVNAMDVKHLLEFLGPVQYGWEFDVEWNKAGGWGRGMEIHKGFIDCHLFLNEKHQYAEHALFVDIPGSSGYEHLLEKQEGGVKVAINNGKALKGRFNKVKLLTQSEAKTYPIYLKEG